MFEMVFLSISSILVLGIVSGGHQDQDGQKMVLAVLVTECENKHLKIFQYQNLLEKRIEYKKNDLF